MRDKFISNDGFEIPLHDSDFTFVEENPRFKDTFWTNYTLPIDIEYTRDFLSKFGHYSSLNAKDLKRYHEGVHLFEGKPRKAKLEIMEFRKDSIKIQIDSGFETLPNFDKKLENLPLLDITVDDIYNHANEVVHKKYPETNYNFPKLYTDEHNLDSEEWKYFDSFINNRAYYESSNGKAFLRNRLENEMDVYNKNIIHPLPYLLYVLKVGFADAGFRLEGEILEDRYLKQRLIWSGKPYYNTGDQKEHKAYIYHEDFFNTNSSNGNITGEWRKKIRIESPGKYKVVLDLELDSQKTANIVVSSKNIAALSVSKNLYFNHNSKNQNFEIDITEDEAILGAEIQFDYNGYHPKNAKNAEGKNIGTARIQINPKRLHTKEGQPIPYVFNEDKVRLKKAMPDMTFGELVTTIKNLRNYDLQFDGNRVTMNVIRLAESDILDFRTFEVADPQRMFNDKAYFNIKFPEHETVELQNIFFDENGYHLNKKNIPETATEISINTFTLPLVMFRGSYTAKAYNDSALMLVYYDGLNQYGDNHATNPAGLTDETVAEHLKPWYMNRLTNYSYKWTFIVEKNKLRKFDIRSEIFCYGKRHLIKSWTKRSLTETLYSVEIETETY